MQPHLRPLPVSLLTFVVGYLKDMSLKHMISVLVIGPRNPSTGRLSGQSLLPVLTIMRVKQSNSCLEMGEHISDLPGQLTPSSRHDSLSPAGARHGPSPSVAGAGGAAGPRAEPALRRPVGGHGHGFPLEAPSLLLSCWGQKLCHWFLLETSGGAKAKGLWWRCEHGG